MAVYTLSYDFSYNDALDVNMSDILDKTVNKKLKKKELKDSLKIAKLSSIPFRNLDVDFDSKHTFVYVDETVKTYRLFGMDITENWEVVINLSDGYVTLGSLLDDVNLTNEQRVMFRALATSMKVGNVVRLANVGFRSATLSDISAAFFNENLPDVSAEDYLASKESFASVILTYLEGNTVIQSQSKGTLESQWKDALELLIRRLREMSELYTQDKAKLALIEVLIKLNKESMGIDKASDAISKICTLTDQDKNDIDGAMIAPTGLVENYNVSMTTDAVMTSAKILDSYVRHGAISSDQANQLLPGFIPAETEPYGLYPDAMIALSRVDAVEYLDDESKVSRELYDFKDQDDVSAYIKAVSNSVRKQLNDYRLDERYREHTEDSVINGLAELNSKTDLYKKFKPINNAEDTSELEDNETGTFKTAELLASNENKALVLKSIKLLSKTTKKVLNFFK